MNNSVCFKITFDVCPHVFRRFNLQHNNTIQFFLFTSIIDYFVPALPILPTLPFVGERWRAGLLQGEPH